MMRTVFIAAASVAAGVVLTGCGTAIDGDPVPAAAHHTAPATTTSSTTTTPVELPAGTIDQLFLEVLNDSGVGGSQGMNDLLLEIGPTVCDAFDEGNGFRTVLDALASPAMDYMDTSRVVGASIAAYCPEHENILDSLDGGGQ